FQDITGVTTSTYSPFSPITQTSWYRRSVTSGSCGTAYSPAILVTVLPQITAPQIIADQTICAGTSPSALTISVAPAGGTGTYTYAWQTSTNEGITFVPL